MAVMTRRRLATDTRRGELIAAGKKIFSRRAYDALSAGDIAAQARVSIGLLYHYFQNKRGFYLATIESLAEDLLAAIAPGASVEAMLDRFLDFVEKNPAAYAALIHGGIGADRQARRIVESVRGAFLKRTLSAMQARKTAGLENALYGWIAMVEASAHHWVAAKTLSRKNLRAELLAVFGAIEARHA